MNGRSLLCLVALAFTVALTAQTPDSDRAEAETRRVTARIRALEAEADRLAGQARTVLGELRKFEIERELQLERVRDAQAAVAKGRAAIDTRTARLNTLEQQRVSQLPDLQAQLVDIYKRGRAGYAKLLFGSTGVREFGRTTRAVAALMKINQERIAEHQRTLDAVTRERSMLEEELTGLQAREAEALKAQAAASQAVRSRAALVAEIDTRRDLNAQLAGELQVANDRLQQLVAGTNQPVEPITIPIAAFQGALDWPVAGRVTGRFGQRGGSLGNAGVRNGMEIAAQEGTPVRAIHSGTVSYAEPFTGFGNVVIVDHGANIYSLYGYLGSMSVARGLPVDSTTEVGRVGMAPLGPSVLYLEIRVDGRSVDPVQWLKPR